MDLTTRTDEKKRLFLASLAEGNSVARAARDIGYSRTQVYEWRKTDPEFAMAWEDAIEAGTDELEDHAVQRAKDGSDTLLIFMLKARRPERYKERYSTETKVTTSDKMEAWLDRLDGLARELNIDDHADAIAILGPVAGSA